MMAAKTSLFLLAATVAVVAATGCDAPPAFGAEALGFSMKASIHLDDASLPNSALTPGDALKQVKARDLCGDAKDQGKDRLPRVPSAALCEAAFADYRIAPAYRFQYACRFLVPVEIGGASTSRNVWPQPAPEAVAKDILDRDVQKRVCNEEVSPSQAQSDIATDWVQAYRHYLLPGDPTPIYVQQPSDGLSGGPAGPSTTPATLPTGGFQGTAGSLGRAESDGPRPTPGGGRTSGGIEAPQTGARQAGATLDRPTHGAIAQPVRGVARQRQRASAGPRSRAAER